MRHLDSDEAKMPRHLWAASALVFQSLLVLVFGLQSSLVRATNKMSNTGNLAIQCT